MSTSISVAKLIGPILVGAGRPIGARICRAPADEPVRSHAF